jgi:hypothetical protein
MTSTMIIHGTNAGSRPNFWMLNSGKSILVEGAPGSVQVKNAGAGRCTAVEADGNDVVSGNIAELAPGDTMNIVQGKRFRISALASCQLLLAWSP